MNDNECRKVTGNERFNTRVLTATYGTNIDTVGQQLIVGFGVCFGPIVVLLDPTQSSEHRPLR